MSLSNPFQPSLKIICDLGGANASEAPGLTPTLHIRLIWNKRVILLGWNVTKQFSKVETWDQCYKTPLATIHDKLECLYLAGLFSLV